MRKRRTYERTVRPVLWLLLLSGVYLHQQARGEEEDDFPPLILASLPGVVRASATASEHSSALQPLNPSCA